MIMLSAFFSGALIYGSCIILFFGVCKFLVAFCADLGQRTESLNREFLLWIDHEQAEHVQYRLKARFFALVAFHCDNKTLAERIANMYNRVLATFIITGLGFMGTNLFEIHLVGCALIRWSEGTAFVLSIVDISLQSVQSNNIMAMINAFSRTTTFLPMFMLTCDLGEMVTAAFGEIDEPVYAQAWHLWPLDLQKDIIPVLIAAQRPVTFKGFFALDCSRDTFKRVSSDI